MSPDDQKKILEANGYTFFKGAIVNPRNQAIGMLTRDGGLSIKDAATEKLLATASVPVEKPKKKKITLKKKKSETKES